MFKRKGGRVLALGHKPRGRQRVRHDPRRAAPVRQGPTAQQSVVGTQTATPPGVFSSAAGGAGWRTLVAPPSGRAQQPFSLGFFTPFAVGGAPHERTRAAVPFSDAPQPQSAAALRAPPAQLGRVAPVNLAAPQRSTVFPR